MQKGIKFTVESVKYDFPHVKSLPKAHPGVFALLTKCLVREVDKRLSSEDLEVRVKELYEMFKEKEK